MTVTAPFPDALKTKQGDQCRKQAITLIFPAMGEFECNRDVTLIESLNRMPNEHLLAEWFEGREAIYIEKGAVRVRILTIRFDPIQKEATAEVEELPTQGLDFVGQYSSEFDAQSPRRWRIATTALAGSTFTSSRWSGGAYVGWSLFFDPDIVHGVVKLAETFPADLHPGLRYRQVLKFIYDRNMREGPTAIFTVGN